MVKNYFLLLLTLASCANLARNMDDSLTLQMEPFMEKSLKTQGYYYNNYLKNYYDVIFLFQDGAIYTKVFEAKDLEEIDFKISSEYANFKAESTSNPVGWGLFNIRADTLVLNLWFPGEGPKSTGYKVGRLMTDTSFVIEALYNERELKKGEVRSLNQTYHFRSFPAKIDSSQSPFYLNKKYRSK